MLWNVGGWPGGRGQQKLQLTGCGRVSCSHVQRGNTLMLLAKNYPELSLRPGNSSGMLPIPLTNLIQKMPPVRIIGL